MEQTELIERFFARDASVLEDVAADFGTLCQSIAMRFLNSPEDAEECCNDTWMRAWNSIPPQRPSSLRAYLAKITRNLAYDRLRRTSAEKRSAEARILLEELSETLADTQSVEAEADAAALAGCVKAFLGGLSARDRNVFLRRYFYGESAEEIAQRYHLAANHVPVILSRVRSKLRKHLVREGWLTERSVTNECS